MLGHTLSLARQQLVRLSEHVTASGEAVEPVDMQSVFHYSKLVAMFEMGGVDTPKFETTPTVTSLTQQQVNNHSFSAKYITSAISISHFPDDRFRCFYRH